MKKFAFIVFLLGILVGCEGNNQNLSANPKTELTVFAAASMTETLEEIKILYEEENESINIIYTFDSSGTLKSQIEEGAEVDLFISAAQKQMDELDPQISEKEINYPIDPSTRIDLLENKVTLVVPYGNPKNIHSFKEINKEKIESVALGNSDVPVGQYSKELLSKLRIWNDIQGKVTFGSNAKEVTIWVLEGVVDCGIVYATDAYSTGLEIIDIADDNLLKNKVVYPAGIINNSKNKREAEKFLDFLKEKKASEIFESVGFLPIN